MNALHLLTPAALLLVLGLVTGLSWPTSSSLRQQEAIQPQPFPPLAVRADPLQARRTVHWVF
ncbi:hypothetical protein [Pseudomonas sp. GOM6]|uniref:hypothetical protein n=1 Tax=Pseudomonas sp. GOM6 TaxID=3036944 RepID=UPI00240A838F|nr:hypothetical protein [Pseudomonas sp. GOM6]MDG1579467.1 hypothetical protein [Pseudomonas sp. GOM6]